MSARMKSKNADPDWCGRGRWPAASALHSVSGFLVPCVEPGGDGGTGLDRGLRAACRHGAGRLVRRRWDEVVAFEDALQRIPDQRIGFPEALYKAGADRRRCQAPGDVDEQPPAGLVHRPRGRHPPERKTEGFHGVGHHLLMTDGDIEVVLLVVDGGGGEQRGDRPALDGLEAGIYQATFDILWAA